MVNAFPCLLQFILPTVTFAQSKSLVYSDKCAAKKPVLLREDLPPAPPQASWKEDLEIYNDEAEPVNVSEKDESYFPESD